MVARAARLFDGGQACGPEANMGCCWRPTFPGNWPTSRCKRTGGFGFAEEYDIERKFRETRLYQVAPISTNLILSYLAEHVLGLPRSY